MSPWFLLAEAAPRPTAENMAIDEFLLEYCREHTCGFFRLYSWDIPSFSFGVSQKISRAVQVPFIEQGGYRYVRRITGGKTVLHDDEITYAVVSSEEIFYGDHDLHQSYLLISKVLVDALQRIGVAAYLSSGSPSELSRSSNPCFSFPTRNEIEVGGKKIVGSAQKRDKFALLQHGSIPLRMNYELYAAGSGFSASALSESMTTLSEVSGKSSAELRAALVSAFHDFIGGGFQEFHFTEAQQRRIVELTAKYASREWNFAFA